jgi:hypothetical protein
MVARQLLIAIGVSPQPKTVAVARSVFGRSLAAGCALH